MNDLCADIGYSSILHHSEELCGDQVEITNTNEGADRIIVLADGLGSGVRASILSTLTAKMLSTMLAAGLSPEECIETVAKTLPVNPSSGVAYSTFTVIHIVDNHQVSLIQYDNPLVMLIRNGVRVDYSSTMTVIQDKKVYRSSFELSEGDVLVAMSDGCPYAGISDKYNFGWQEKDIADFIGPIALAGYSARNLASILIDKVNELYDHHPKDDATAVMIKIRKRQYANVLFGPPANVDDNSRMMALFFSKDGYHIIAGGTTSKIAAKYLGEELIPNLDYLDDKIPPTATLKGADLVTEGVITMSAVLEHAEEYLKNYESFRNWDTKQDGASLMARMLFEEATDITFYVGKAVNPAQQTQDNISFDVKMGISTKLVECLKKMGKQVKITYF